ncbi:MAG: hypothetical protein E7609_03750 [Ruminococcaceae bacterium]|nr:hypothetical protein [Oscillospiraceae bacterium]
MTLLFDGQNAFFAERGKSFVKSLIIHLPKDGALFFNGICYFPEAESVHLPKEALRIGDNRLALRIGNRIFPTESLRFDGECFTPTGLSAEALLLRQNELLSSLEERLAHLSDRVAHLEQQSTARTLFS